MRGAIAAGSAHAADAGAWALAEGGTAVDATIAAVLAAFVVEGPLTGPAGGGFLLLHEPRAEPVVLDCFFAVPRSGRGAMDEVVIDFGDASTQSFHVGEASVAVPGLVAGLAEAHERRGLLRWRDLFVPALELAQAELPTEGPQAFLHEILVPILQREEGGRRIYGRPGTIVSTDLVPTLLALRDGGAGELATLLPDLADDLAVYRVEEREPLGCAFAGIEIRTTPEPSRGGMVVVGGLAELDGALGDGRPGDLRAEARAIARGISAGYGALGAGAKPTGTTHVSAIDRDGAAVGLSSTLGSGSGVFRHGFQLNNMLGELDVIGTEPRDPGTRLPSMMTPTLALEEGGPRLVAGSAGSVRLAGAVLQVVAGVVGSSLGVAEAIERPRLHVDGDTVHVEGGWPAAVTRALADDGWNVVEWNDRNLFFGGAAAVERRRDGRLAAAGDPRRGGRGVVVS